jgi:hypothetical protein
MAIKHAGDIAQTEQSIGQGRGGGLVFIGEIAGAGGHDDLAGQEFQGGRIGCGFGFDKHGGSACDGLGLCACRLYGIVVKGWRKGRVMIWPEVRCFVG